MRMKNASFLGLLLIFIQTFITCQARRTYTCPPKNGRVKIKEKEGFIIDSYTNYTMESKCTWIIEAKSTEFIYLRLEEFSTECNWDHLYIWDGHSVQSQLIATFSGDMKDFDQAARNLVAKSGFALIHFYSDAAYSSSGFNISFTVCEESDNCSPSHAKSFGRTIGCDETFSCAKQGFCINQHCICHANHSGIDCSGRGYWSNAFDNEVQIVDGLHGWKIRERKPVIVPPKAASNAIAHKDSQVYFFAGETLAPRESMSKVYKYDLDSSEWTEFSSQTSNNPYGRNGHSAVWYDEKQRIYIYGGMINGTQITNELWLWAIDLDMFVLVDPKACNEAESELATSSFKPSNFNNDVEGTFADLNSLKDRAFGDDSVPTNDQLRSLVDGNFDRTQQCASPIPSTGHTAHIVNNTMLIFFGYSGSKIGFIPYIQEFDIINRKWSIIKPRGAIAKGTFGHASVYDEFSGLIYLAGGVHQVNNRISTITQRMLSYNPQTKVLKHMKPMPAARFLLAGVTFNNGILLFSGGNPHSPVNSNQCFTDVSYTFDTKCQRWEEVNVTDATALHASSPLRYGHSAVQYNREVYLFAGFRGSLLNDERN